MYLSVKLMLKKPTVTQFSNFINFINYLKKKIIPYVKWCFKIKIS